MDDPLDSFPEVGVPPAMQAEHYGAVAAVLKSRGFAASLHHSGLAPVIEVTLDNGLRAWWINSEDGWGCTIFREDGPDFRQTDAPMDAAVADVAKMIEALDYEAQP